MNIKPCPFCGSRFSSVRYRIEYSRHPYDEEYDKLYYVECHRCIAHGPLATTKEKAVAHWNHGIEKIKV